MLMLPKAIMNKAFCLKSSLIFYMSYSKNIYRWVDHLCQTIKSTHKSETILNKNGKTKPLRFKLIWTNQNNQRFNVYLFLHKNDLRKMLITDIILKSNKGLKNNHQHL